MKQHITVEQLNELNQSEKHRLGLWCYKHKYFCVLRVTPPGEYGSMSDLKTGKHWMIDKPLLSICQMIEFLYEKRKRDWCIYFGKKLAFVIANDGTTALGKTSTVRNGELCDGLWILVKELLEGEVVKNQLKYKE